MKKIFKSALALSLALIMVFSLCAPAFSVEYKKIGGAIESLQNVYNDSHKKLTGRGGMASLLEKMKKQGG